MQNSSQSDLVFTAYITLKNGKRLYARQVGKKAFCFPRKESQNNDDNKNN